jgi:tight adherence protein C
MTLLLLFGLSLVAASAGLALRAIALPRLRAAQRIEAIAGYGDVRKDDGGTAEGRALDRVAAALGALIAARIGRIDLVALRRRLLRAGAYGTRAETLVGYCALAGLALLVVGLLVPRSGLLVVLLPLSLAAGGAFAPVRFVKLRADKRGEQIEDGLPDLIDLLVVMIEAGLTFSSALQMATKRIDGALGQELRLALQEQRMGLPITDALRNMLRRSETPSMRSFVRSVVQGEALGVSIGTIMRNLAEEMRKRRRGRAEERAHKAPVKLLFPLVFLMFPPVFVVLLGPAVLDIKEALGGIG